MDMDELAIQREGYAQAIVSSKEFWYALKALLNGKAPLHHPLRMGGLQRMPWKIIIPWRLTSTALETADAVANEIYEHAAGAAPRLAHLDLRRDLFCGCCCSTKIPITASAA